MLDLFAQAKAWVQAQYWSRRDHRSISAGSKDAGLPVALSTTGYLGTSLFTPSDPWTPTIAFGGNAVGLTYSLQVGRYSRYGNIVVATGFVALSAKGSSTGAARLRGLPVASKNVTNFLQPFFVRMDDMTGTSGSYSAFVQPNASECRLDFSGTGVVTEMTDAHFTNSSSIMVMAVYEV